MKISRDWSRSECIKEVRSHIWKYLSPSSLFDGSGLLLAGALLQWPLAEASRLGELQFLLCQEVGDFLSNLPVLTRQLANSSELEEEPGGDRLGGFVDWEESITRRRITGNPYERVTFSARRVYQTTENEILVHVLDAVVTLGERSDWGRGKSDHEPVKLIRDRLAEAKRLQQNRSLAEVDRIPPKPQAVTRVRRGRNHVRYAQVLRAYDKLEGLVEQLDRKEVQKAVEEAGLVTATDSILFELRIAFGIIDGLNELGWTMNFITLFEGQVHTTGRASDGRILEFWYQGSPKELTDSAQYQRILKAHHFDRATPLRPDVVLRWTDFCGQRRWLLVECKLIKPDARRGAREALQDLLTYRANYESLLSGSKAPYGLGITWGQGLKPESGSGIMLCTPDTLLEALRDVGLTAVQESVSGGRGES